MKSLAFAFILLLAIKTLASDSPDTREISDPKTITSRWADNATPIPVDDLFFTRSTGGGAWSPDGKQIVFFTNLTGRNNLWKVNADGGWPIQLSQSEDRQQFASWSPDGTWIVFQSDKGGGEIYDLYAIPSNGGAVVNLTNSPDVSETGAVWSVDGRFLAFEYKPKTSSTIDIAILDWNSRSVRNLTQEKTPDHLWGGPIWSPDSKFVYATRSNAAFTDSDVFQVNVANGAQENLTKHEGEHRASVSSISSDKQVLLITSDKPGGYPNVALLNIPDKKMTWVTDTKWEASAGDFSPDGKQFTYERNADGRNDVYLADTATLRSARLHVPEGLNSYAGNPRTFSPDGRSVLVSHQSSTQPGDLWVYDVAKGEARQLSFSAIASLRAVKIPDSQLVHYRSFDGKVISAFVWVPFNLQRDGSNPAIVLPHGGPAGQITDFFNRTVVALVTRGYVCIAPNVRGSTGYGMDFQKANYQDLGGGDLQDEVYAARFLGATGFVDKQRIGITGGSYGGYMTMMAIGKTPDVWAAGVEEYGIINWLTMMQNEDPLLQQYEKSLLGDPQKDRTVYQAASPLAYIRNARAPLLVLQGENDIRVPKEEAEQVVRILRDAGKTVDVRYYPTEGHGFVKRENQIDAIQRTIAWFDRYLKVKN